MREATTIIIRTETGFESHHPVPPACWRGEPSCLVGPFSSRQVAEHFARPAVEFGHHHVEIARIFAKRDSWYVEMGPTAHEPLAPDRRSARLRQ